MKSISMLIILAILLSGCIGDKAPNGTATPTPVISPQENISYLFFEVYLLPPENITFTAQCAPLWATYVDFPTYYFNRSERHLQEGIVPAGAYDFIKFNASLKAIVGVGYMGYSSGVSSQLEPIYSLPYASIGKQATAPNYWVYSEEMGKVRVMNITVSGSLVVSFDNQTVEIAPGSSWSKQIRTCGERIQIENHGYLNKTIAKR